MYADDLLLSAPVTGLQHQHMLNICHTFGLNNSISFNHSKTSCMKVGPRSQRQTNQLCIGIEKLQWVTNVKYLDVVFKSGNTFKVDTGYIKRKFYTSCNGILALCKSVDEFVKLSLVKSYCLSLLSYCIGALDVTGQQLRELAVCWNDCFRRIFGFKRHESVRLLQFYCNELPFEFMHDLFKWKFFGRHSMLNASNRCFIYYVIKRCDDVKLREKYDFASSARDKHSAIFEYFRLSVS